MDIFGLEAGAVWRSIEYACLVRTRNPRLAVRFDSDDLLAEVRLTAQRDRAAFHGTTADELEAWLECIVHSRFCDLYDKHAIAQKRTVRREEALEQYEAASRCMARSLASPDTSPSSRAARNERAAAVQDAIRTLPEPDRTRVVLRFVYDATLREIAERTGGTTSSVNYALIRAMKVLADLLPDPQE